MMETLTHINGVYGAMKNTCVHCFQFGVSEGDFCATRSSNAEQRNRLEESRLGLAAVSLMSLSDSEFACLYPFLSEKMKNVQYVAFRRNKLRDEYKDLV